MAARSAFAKRFASAGFAVSASFGLSLLASAPGTAWADSFETLQPGVLQCQFRRSRPGITG